MSKVLWKVTEGADILWVGHVAINNNYVPKVIPLSAYWRISDSHSLMHGHFRKQSTMFFTSRWLRKAMSWGSKVPAMIWLLTTTLSRKCGLHKHFAWTLPSWRYLKMFSCLNLYVHLHLSSFLHKSKLLMDETSSLSVVGFIV